MIFSHDFCIRGVLVQLEVRAMSTSLECAEYLEMSITTFSGLVSKGIVTKRSKGNYSFDEVRVEYIKHIRSVAANRMTTEGQRGPL